ncbi:hypothetical protein EYF80_008732 [Liparis tanakae]|uniref:Uncharacterized protein n=1 Tax=Liparis tanakae TaxID=230148 RepID=A0A4Z2IT99_9TELE|nr:hypothetical protein EYF80_008732 [Liparis tanakae]
MRTVIERKKERKKERKEGRKELLDYIRCVRLFELADYLNSALGVLVLEENVFLQHFDGEQTLAASLLRQQHLSGDGERRGSYCNNKDSALTVMKQHWGDEDSKTPLSSLCLIYWGIKEKLESTGSLEMSTSRRTVWRGGGRPARAHDC